MKLPTLFSGRARRRELEAKVETLEAVQKAFGRVTQGNTGWYRLFESFSGAWQGNVTVDRDAVLTYFANFACMTLIASDISKLRVKLLKRSGLSVWQETAGALATVEKLLRKPNPFQNRIQFFESWVLSKLATGNTYALKRRDGRGRVVELYILDPRRCFPLVSDDGSIFYELSADNVVGIMQAVIVPASEIIHDRFNTLYHPLVGMSPIEAAGVSATGGMAIQNNAAKFFQNASRPGGILSAPGEVGSDTLDRLKATWDANFSGDNSGKVAVLGDGLKFEAMAMSAVDSQMIEQAKWSAETVCSVFHVPTYKIGIGEIPKYDSIQALNVEYYTQALQSLIESLELCLDEGLEIDGPIDGEQYSTEFDLDGLLRMDSAALYTSLGEGVKGTILSPNEARAKVGLPPVAGGESPLSQQQNYSLAALAKRDAKEDPFAGSAAPAAPPADPASSPADPPAPPDGATKAALAAISKGFEEALRT